MHVHSSVMTAPTAKPAKPSSPRRIVTIAVAAVLALVALPVVLWFGFPFLSYRIYMAWLASGVKGEYGRLPSDLAGRLAPHYDTDLASASYAFTTRLPGNLAVSDCATVYFGDPGIVAHLRTDLPLTPREMRWLAHELTHGEQCRRWGGRGRFAETWFSQADAQAWQVVRRGGAMDALREWLRTRNVAGIHDPMPMEIEADDRARAVMDALR